MLRKCPRCGSYNVRRSSVRASGTSPPPAFRSPYRCRDCGERFLVIGRSVYYATAGFAFGVVIVGWAIWLVVMRAPDFGSSPGDPSSAVATQARGTIEAAERGDPTAEHQLAQMYAAGDGVERDERKAVEWLERSAAHGDPEAQYELGVALRDGRGTLQDDERAFEWLQRSAETGNVRAQFELGRMYFAGTGTRVDKVKAYTWLNVAAAQGAPEAVLLRDIVRGQLSAEEIGRAQADSRRLGERRPVPTPGDP